MSDYDQLQIRKVDGGLLLIFRELLLRRRASEVAAQLGLSQSAISHALGRLRDLFGDPLFIRRSHGMEPTRRALELAPRLDALIELIGEITSSDDGFDPAKAERRFRIVCPAAMESLLGGGLAEAFRKTAPRCTFSMRWAILDRALRAVRRGEADVALGIFSQLPPGLVGRPLFEDEYCVIARKGHPLVDGEIDARTYARAGHIFVATPDGALGDEPAQDRESIEATYGDVPGPHLIRTQGYVTQWETAMLIVATTDVLADCPRRLAARYADRLGLQVLDMPFPRFRFTIQAVRRGETSDPGLDWFMERLAEAAA